MSLKCSVLKSGFCEITQGFGGSNNHRGLDLVGPNYTIDDIVSYANGTVSMATNGYGNGQGEGVNWAYGNFVKIINDDGSVVKEITPVQTGKLPLSDSTLSLIQEGLLAVTQEGGTASNLASLPVAVAGKTGTAENPHGQDHGLFVAYAPAKDPSLVVVAVVEQGSYGSLSAAPIVQGILEAVFAPPKPTESGQLPKK